MNPMFLIGFHQRVVEDLLPLMFVSIEMVDEGLGGLLGGVSCWETPIGVHGLNPAILEWRMGMYL